jgi:hypothetical protein
MTVTPTKRLQAHIDGLNPPVRPAKAPVIVNLDNTTRTAIVAAACASLDRAGMRAFDLGEWRQRAADWSHHELLQRAVEAGVQFVRSNKPYALPQEITPIRRH